MAGGRGYRSYRGKSSKKKMVLAAFLLLVILAALAVALMQKYIFYDETGAPHLEVPWQEGNSGEPEEETVELDLVIRPAEDAEESPLRGFMIPEGPLSVASRDAIPSGGEDWNSVVVTLKDGTGTVYYNSTAATYSSVAVTEETASVLTEWTTDYAVARIACFRDPKAANADVERLGLKNVDGYSFYDGNNSQWLDPAKPAAREYLCAIAREAAELGFHEILLTDVTYPTEGKVDEISYGEGGRQDHLLMFLQEMRTALKPYGVKLSLEIPVHVIRTGEDDLAGLNLTEIAPLADRLCAKVLPAEAEACETAVTAACGETAFLPILAAEEADHFAQSLIQ